MLPSVSRLKLNVAATWLTHVVSMAIGFVLMPFVLGTLGDNGYGLWIVINSIAGYAGVLYLGGGDTVTRYVSHYHAKNDVRGINAVVSLIFTVYVVMAGVGLLAAGLLAWSAQWWPQVAPESLFEARCVILILGLNVGVGLVGSVFGGVLHGLQRHYADRLMLIVSDVLKLVLIVTLLRSEWGLLTIASIFFVIALGESIAYTVLAFRALPTLSVGLRHLDLAMLKECLGFSSFSFLNSIAYQMMTTTDTLVVGFVLIRRDEGTEAIVPYYIALRLAQIVRAPIQQIGGIVMPAAGAFETQGRRTQVHRLVYRSMAIVFLLASALLIGAAWFADTLVFTWVKRTYTDCYPLVLVFFAAQLFSLPIGMLRSILAGMGHVRVPALIALAEAIFKVALGCILGLWWRSTGTLSDGMMGVAAATFISVLIFEFGIMLPYAMRVLELRLGSLASQVLLRHWPSLTVLTAFTVYMYSFEFSPRRYLMVIIGLSAGVVLAVSLYIESRIMSWWERRLEAKETTAAGPSLPMTAANPTAQ